MRSFVSLAVSLVLLGSVRAGEDPVELEAKLKKVREQLETLRVEERVLAEKLAAASTSGLGIIKVEVTGVLRHNPKGPSYYISVWNPNGETRLWLLEPHKALLEKMGPLHGKHVVAKGTMAQHHEPRSFPNAFTTSQVPLGAFYLYTYDVEPAPDTTPKK